MADASFFEWVGYFITNYWPQFLNGAGVTLLIAITGTIIGSLIGLIIGIIRTIPKPKKGKTLKRFFHKFVNVILSCYIEIFRGTPMIVQAMVIFYGCAFAGLYLPRTTAAIFIVSINTGAYMAEIVRGGILSIDKGQFEAAQSLGMTHWQTMTSVVLPQAIRNILPATGNEFVINIKDTSVLNVISVSELFFTSQTIAGISFQYFPVFLITCVLYFIMTFTVTRILRFAEKRMAGKDTYTIHASSTMPKGQLKVTKEH